MKNNFISNIGIGTRNTLDFNQNIPKLIEPGVHGFLKENLRNCGIKKSMYVNKLYNLGMLILFLSIFSGEYISSLDISSSESFSIKPCSTGRSFLNQAPK